MRLAALSVLILGSLTIFAQQKTSAKTPGKSPHVASIQFTLSSGMCYGYCWYQLDVEPGRAILSTNSTDQDKQKCPDLKVTAALSSAHWKELSDLVDHQAALALPDRIGCPGCVDEVIESLQVRFTDHGKKSTYYNAGSPPQEIKALSEQLAALKEKLAKELPPRDLIRCNPK